MRKLYALLNISQTLFIIILAKSSIFISLFAPTKSTSYIISSISCSCIFSPIVVIAYLNSSAVILLSWSLSNTCKAAIKSSKESLSAPLSFIVFSNCYKLNLLLFIGSIFFIRSIISYSVGFKLRALIIVPSSVVWTYPSLSLSNKANISLISEPW